MVVAMVWSGWIPVVLKVLDDGTSPLLMFACWRVGSSAVCLAALAGLGLWAGGGALRGLWRLRRRFISVPVGMMVLAGTEYCFYLLASRLIDPAVATVVVESYFIFSIVIMLVFSRGRYADSILFLALVLPMCLGGLAFLAAAEYGGFSVMVEGLGRGVLEPLVGGGLALVGSLAIAGAFLVFRWAEEMGRSLALGAGGGPGAGRMGLVALCGAALVGNVSSAVLMGGLGLAGGAALPGWGASLLWVLMGVVVMGPTLVFWRLAVYLSRYAGIAALGGLAPVVSLCLFWAFSMVTVPRADYLVAGVALVVGAGALLQVPGPVGGLAVRVMALVRR